jgi:polyketide cyclase/dehydrase/lipid transport protein
LTRHRITVSAPIAAAPKQVYKVLADYRDGHRHILPRRFSDLTVERGGFGAGTIIRFRVRVGGRRHTFRAAVSEPEPGRVLVEANLDGKVAVTTFTVAAEGADDTSTVTIATEQGVRSGLLGVIERFITTRELEALYREELRKLAAFVSGSAAGANAHV